MAGEGNSLPDALTTLSEALDRFSASGGGQIVDVNRLGVQAINNLAQYVSQIPGILTPLSPANGGTGIANGALNTITLSGPFVYVGTHTVATLPSAVTSGAGARGFVTDANSTTFAAAAVGGGANAVPVVSTGAGWILG